MKMGGNSYLISSKYYDTLKEAAKMVEVDLFCVEWKKLGEVEEIKTILPKRKLKKQEYLEIGKYPIIDQGQKFIIGYTNDDSAVFDKDSYIVFGDHTESVKFVDFKFAQGADGIKILKSDKEYINLRYLYHLILNFYKPTGKYMRHFCLLKETNIPILSLAVQEYIVSILDKFDSLVNDISQGLPKEIELRQKQYEYYREKLLSCKREI